MTSFRTWATSLVLLSFMLLSSACRTTSSPAVSQVNEVSGSQSVESGDRPEQSSWQPDGRGGRLEDSGSGFSFELPMGWTWARGSGGVLFEARGPQDLPARLVLKEWDRQGGDGELRSQDEALVFVGKGPYGGLERLADEPPLVLTREAGSAGELLLSWLFVVDARGLRLDARLPGQNFEQAWRAVDTIVRSAEVPERKAER